MDHIGPTSFTGAFVRRKRRWFPQCEHAVTSISVTPMAVCLHAWPRTEQYAAHDTGRRWLHERRELAHRGTDAQRSLQRLHAAGSRTRPLARAAPIHRCRTSRRRLRTSPTVYVGHRCLILRDGLPHRGAVRDACV